jgi:hypothetical protein
MTSTSAKDDVAPFYEFQWKNGGLLGLRLLPSGLPQFKQARPLAIHISEDNGGFSVQKVFGIPKDLTEETLIAALYSRNHFDGIGIQRDSPARFLGHLAALADELWSASSCTNTPIPPSLYHGGATSYSNLTPGTSVVLGHFTVPPQYRSLLIVSYFNQEVSKNQVSVLEVLP